METTIDPEGRHRHQCNGCGTVWEHDDECHGMSMPHRCPRCGEEQFDRYTGDNPAEFFDHHKMRKRNADLPKL